jgi:hypothetical protein
VILTGLAAGFVGRWMQGFLLGFLVGTPISLFVTPLVQRLVAWMTSEPRGSAGAGDDG